MSIETKVSVKRRHRSRGRAVPRLEELVKTSRDHHPTGNLPCGRFSKIRRARQAERREETTNLSVREIEENTNRSWAVIGFSEDDLHRIAVT
jgi:hypothetical protein